MTTEKTVHTLLAMGFSGWMDILILLQLHKHTPEALNHENRAETKATQKKLKTLNPQPGTLKHLRPRTRSPPEGLELLEVR